jgi:hypothetical protein
MPNRPSGAATTNLRRRWPGRTGRTTRQRRPLRWRADYPDFAIEVVAGQTQQFGQVPAGGLTPGSNTGWVDPDLIGSCSQPADRSLGVVQLRRPLRLPGQPVVDTGDRDPRLRQAFERTGRPFGVRGPSAMPAAELPAPAVQEYHRRNERSRHSRQVEVEFQRPDSRDRRVRHACKYADTLGRRTGRRQRQGMRWRRPRHSRAGHVLRHPAR